MKEANWNELIFWDKIRLFDIWAIISIIANLSQIIGCTYYIFRYNFDLQVADTLLGLGCMLAWWTMLRYFLKTQAYKSMLASFIKSAPFVSRALISMIPLFIGYAFLGMAIFWESRRFQDFNISCYTLFSLMHGDMIWDTYNDLIQIDNMLAQLYLYSWIFISVCVIANIFTIIIEEGFMKQKYDNNYAWLHQHIKRHLGLEDSKGEDEDEHANDRDGINVDSEVIISEYRLLYMKYKKQISMYKEAIANLSLKQIINNEEEAWVQHRMAMEKENEENGDNDSFIDKDAGKLTEQAEKIVINVRAYEFD